MRALVLIVLSIFLSGQAWADPPAPFCARIGTNDTLRHIPRSLVPAAQSLFHLGGDEGFARRSTVFRCMDGHVLLCNAGANLVCAKAAATQTLPAGDQFCHDNPNAGSIPMVVTGHDTIYSWKCVGTHAEAGAPTETVDARGFLARLWKPLP